MCQRSKITDHLSCEHTSPSNLFKFHWFLSITLIFLFSIDLSAQMFTVRNYNMKDGLASFNTHCISLDSAHNIWVATDYGISQYNGLRWKNFNPKDGIATGAHTFVHTDAKNCVWIVPESRDLPIQVLREGKIHETIPSLNNYKKTSTILSVNSLTINGKTIFYVGTENGLLRYSDGGWKIVIDSIRINSITFRNNRLYLATQNGIFRINADQNIEKVLSIFTGEILQCLPTKVFEDAANDELLYMDQSAIFRLKNGKKQLVTIKKVFPKSSVQDKYFLAEDDEQNIFYGNRFVKYWFSQNTHITNTFSIRNGFAANGATSALIDHEGNLWFSSTRGIDKVQNLYTYKYDSRNGLLEDEVSSIIEFAPGEFVIGHNEGFSILKNKQVLKIPFGSWINEVSAYTRVLDMALVAPNRILFAASQLGLGILHTDLNSIQWLEISGSESFNSVLKSNGKLFVLSNRGFYQLTTVGLVKLQDPHRVYNIARKMFSFPGMTSIYLVGYGGVLEFNDGSFTRISDGVAPIDFNTYSLEHTEGKKLLAGTFKGLYTIENRNIYPSTDNKFLSDPVYAMLKDSQNRFWYGTQNGVILKLPDGTVSSINSGNGLIGDEVNRDALVEDSFGNIIIGTNKGITIIANNFSLKHSSIPEIIFEEGIASDGTIFNLNENASLSAGNKGLTFKLHAVSYVNEDSLMYRVNLMGYSDEWMTLSQAQIEHLIYRSIEPGEYQLQVQVRNDNGAWSNIRKSGIISINMPLYSRWWFVLFNLLVATAGIIHLVRSQNRKKLLKSLEIMVTDRTQALNKSQEELSKINTQLEIRVQQRTAALENANNALIEEIKKKELIAKNLIESRSKLLQAHQVANLGNWDLDFGAEIVIHGERILPIFKSESGLSQIPIREFIERFIPMHERSKIVQLLHQAKKEGSITPTDLEIHLSDGTVKYVHIEAIVRKDEFSGRPIGASGIIQDITERVETAKQLESINKELVAINAGKDKFFSIIAHDLRSPFQSLLGFVNILHDQLDELDINETKKFVEGIRDTTKRLYLLLEDLLSWSRLQMGVYQISPVSISLKLLITEVIQIQKPIAEKKSIEIKSDIQDPLTIFADESMLMSVIRNLLSNAIKFSHIGGMISITASQKGSVIEMKISDNGIGMDEQKIESLFSVDKVVSTPGTEGERGSGLGLILVKEMIEKHHGTISVQSSTNHGTTCTVVLPIGEREN